LGLARLSALASLGLVGEELGRNVWDDTTLGDDDVSKELVQLLVVLDCQLKMAGHDTRLLVVWRKLDE
jgi:hypothetical protein